MIEVTETKGHRSERDYDVIVSLLAQGYTEETIIDVFDNYPVGDKYRETGIGYLRRTIESALRAIAIVKIQYADVNDRRLHLAFRVVEGEKTGELIRCGISMPAYPNDELDERWKAFWIAAGIIPPYDSIPSQRLINKTLRVLLDTRGHRRNPVVSFHRI